MGICCSISRQALIFKRRHTQQRGSLPTVVVSPPHTEHFATLVVSLSLEIDRLACSSRSAGTTGSGLPWIFLFILDPVPPTTIAKTEPLHNLSAQVLQRFVLG